MKNHKFYCLMRDPRGADNKPIWTVARLAREMGSSRAHVAEVLNNVPGHGHRTRPKLISVLRSNFAFWRDMVAALGWDERGKLLVTVTVMPLTDGSRPCSTWNSFK
jgi:hypothetical protein